MDTASRRTRPLGWLLGALAAAVALLAQTAASASDPENAGALAPSLQGPVTTYDWVTLAGDAGHYGSTDGTGAAARFDLPAYIALDAAGNLYVADEENSAIRKVSPAGAVTTLLSNYTQNTTVLNGIWGIVVDGSGNVFFSELGNGTIMEVTPAGVVSVLAGGGAYTSGGQDGTGTAARFSYPSGLAMDSAGNIYVADRYNNTIREVTPAGVVTTLAGTNGSLGFTDGTGSAARFFEPQDVAVDAAGNVYVADTMNGAVRKVTPAGVVTTVAGPAQQFVAPIGIAVDGAGNLFVTDNDTVREITPAGVITTVGGSPGVAGAADGIGSNALFGGPFGIAVDPAGNLYLSEQLTNNTIVKGGVQTESPPSVATQPQSATVASGANAAFTVAASGAPPLSYQWQVLDLASGDWTNLADGGPFSGTATATLDVTGATPGMNGDQFQCVVTNGTSPAASDPATLGVTFFSGVELQTPSLSVIAGQGASFTVGASGNPVLAYQWQVSTNSGSSWSTLGDGGGYSGTATATLLVDPASASGDQFRATVSNASGSATSAASTLTVQALPGGGSVAYDFLTLSGSPPGYSNVNGTGGAVGLAYPTALAVDCSGTVYAAVQGPPPIATISPQGVVGSFNTGSAQLGIITAIAVDAAGNLYVADTTTIKRITPAGAATTLYETQDFFEAGAVSGMAVDLAGNVYYADSRALTIQKIAPTGVRTTFAGSGVQGSADGQGTAAQFGAPVGVAVDASGNVYVADFGNGTLRKITPGGMVSTLAGSPGKLGNIDGTGSAAGLQGAFAIAADAAGNVYVVDTTYSTIRRVTPAGVVTTCGGDPGVRGQADGVGSAALFSYPGTIAVDSAGNVYVVDSQSGVLRKGVPVALGAGTASQFSITAPQTGDVNSTLSITVTALNALGSPVPGYSGTVHFTSTLPGVVLPPDSAIANGTGTFTVTLGTAGYGTITATETTTSSPLSPISGVSGLIFAQVPLQAQTITVAQPQDLLTTAAPFQLAGSASSGLPVSYAVQGGPASVSGSTVTLTGSPGVVTIVASQGGNSTYSAAPNVTIAFTVYASGIPPAITAQPAAQTANAGATAAFLVQASGSPPLTYQWSLDGTAIPGANLPLLLVTGAQAANAGTYAVSVANASGSVESSTATLTLNTGSSVAPPSVGTQPQPQTVATGSTVVFSVAAGGAATGSSAAAPGVSTRAQTQGSAPAYQWLLGGAPIAGATNPMLVITGATAANAGVYSCLLTDSGGAAVTSGAALSVVSTAAPGRLTNVSCRAQVGTGGNILIAGFVVGGAGTSGSEPVLVRGSGPALAAFSVAGALADPQLQLFGTGSGDSLLAANSGWAGNAQVAGEATAVGAFAWTATTSHDAALAQSLPSGPYTANISGESGDTGVALAEVYDATPAQSYTPASPRLINVSTRVNVGTGGSILIAGFVIGGTTSKTVLIRASGPALVPFSVSGALPDPSLTLFSGSNPLSTNSGWGGAAQVAAAAASVGAFAWTDPSSKDSALLVTLPPGAYTAQVAGASGDTGVALVEIYDVP